MITVQVKNIEKYVPGYKDRILSWVKIYFRDSIDERTHVKYGSFFNDEDIERLDEVARYRYISLVCKQVELGRPVPLDKRRLFEMGWDTKKQSISATLNLLQGLVFPCDGENTIPRNVEEGKIKGKSKEEEEEGVLQPTQLIMSDEGLMNAWGEYIAHRKNLKKPLTPYAERLALSRLEKLSGNDPKIAKEILHDSIANGWLGIFPHKARNGRTQNPNSQVSRATYGHKPSDAERYRGLDESMREVDRVRGERS